MSRTIAFVGARGGQGTSTVAAALAVLAAGQGPTRLVPDDPRSTAALLAVPITGDDEWAEVCPNLVMATNAGRVALRRDATVSVVDGGRLPDDPPRESSRQLVEPAERYVVLRGPCYVALSSLPATGTHFDGVVLLAEHGRALSHRDVTDVLGIPVVATIPVEPAVARAVDAGLFVTRLPRLSQFRSLTRLAGRSCDLTTAPMRSDTDLHLSLCDRCEADLACRVRPLRGAVCRSWGNMRGRSVGVEHREVVSGCGGLLRRRGGHLGGGLLHR